MKIIELHSNKRSLGFSLVEMMVAMVVGLILLGGTLSIFGNNMKSTTESIKTTRLQSELRAVMFLMEDDIRRAGFWSQANATFGQNNIFTAVGANLTIGNKSSEANNSCITYTYDIDPATTSDVNTVDDGTGPDLNERFGFQLASNAVRMRIGGSGTLDCDSGSWQKITDANVVRITALSFDTTNYGCINISNSADVNCAAPVNGDFLQTVRQVDITLTGELTNDSTVSRTLKETVRVRNDRFRVFPNP